MICYADWVFYGTTYLGTAIDVDEFDALALRASAQIDQMTSNRVAEIISDDDDADKVDLIKMAVCSIADEMHKQANEGPQIASERVGSFSKTYVVSGEMKKTSDQRLERVAKLYLGSTELMFKGFSAGEYGGEPSDAD